MLEELTALHEGASPAPWHVCFTNDIVCMSAVMVTKNPSVGREFNPYGDDWPSADVVAACLLQEPDIAGVDDGRWAANARLIASVRNNLPELLRLARIGLAQEQREDGAI